MLETVTNMLLDGVATFYGYTIYKVFTIMQNIK